jgi:hypothetical protein
MRSPLPEHISAVTVSTPIIGTSPPKPRRAPQKTEAPPVTTEMQCFHCQERFGTHKDARLHERWCSRQGRQPIPQIPLDVILGLFQPAEEELYTEVIADRLAELSAEWSGLTRWQVGKAIGRHGAKSHSRAVGDTSKRYWTRTSLRAARDGIVAVPVPTGMVYSYTTPSGQSLWGYKMVSQTVDGRKTAQPKTGFLTRAAAERSLEILKRANELQRRKALKEYAIQLALEAGEEHTPHFRCRCTPRDNECSRWPEKDHGTWFVRLSAPGPAGRIQPNVSLSEFLERGGKVRKPRLRLRVKDAP